MSNISYIYVLTRILIDKIFHNILFCMLVYLKLTQQTDISWWWVWAPVIYVNFAKALEKQYIKEELKNAN